MLDMERKIFISDESNKFFAVQWHIFFIFIAVAAKKGYLQIGAIFYSDICWFECPNWLYFDLLVSILLSIYEDIILYINPISLLILLFLQMNNFNFVVNNYSLFCTKYKNSIYMTEEFFILKKNQIFSMYVQ